MPPVSAGARETQPKEGPWGTGAPASRAGADGGGIVADSSIFDREPDSYGDVVARGAFADTLEVWRESGRPIPLLFGHNMDDPDYRTGDVTSAEEDERGLCAEAAFDPDSPRRSTPQARPRGARHDAHEHVLACSEEA